MSTYSWHTKVQAYLAKIAGYDVDIPAPTTKAQTYLAKLAGYETDELPAPSTKTQELLKEIAENGTSPKFATLRVTNQRTTGGASNRNIIIRGLAYDTDTNEIKIVSNLGGMVHSQEVKDLSIPMSTGSAGRAYLIMQYGSLTEATVTSDYVSVIGSIDDSTTNNTRIAVLFLKAGYPDLVEMTVGENTTVE